MDDTPPDPAESAASQPATPDAAPPAPVGSAPRSALPSPLARVLAFTSILVAGLCGGLIGYAFIDLQCTGDCTAPSSFGGLVGATFTAGGTAIVAVLVLRAMGEWGGDDPSRLRRRPVGPIAEQILDEPGGDAGA